MADSTFIEPFEKLPDWQKLLIFVVGAILIGALWWFVWYSAAKEAHRAAKQSLTKIEGELADAERKKANYVEREAKMAALEAELEKKMDVLPMSVASVDNLMQTFQQQARLVGMAVDSWSPKPEVNEDYHARLPISVSGGGTWPQVGEFFRRVSELDRIVSIDNVSLVAATRRSKGPTADSDESPELNVNFEAATYRFLAESERKTGGRKRSRRKKK